MNKSDIDVCNWYNIMLCCSSGFFPEHQGCINADHLFIDEVFHISHNVLFSNHLPIPLNLSLHKTYSAV